MNISSGIQVDIPKNIGLVKFRRDISWLDEVMPGRYVWFWPNRYITFEDEEDASIFILKIGGRRSYSKIEEMIKEEI